MNEIISIILLSLFVSVISTLAATVFGVLISLVILFKDFRLKKLVIKDELTQDEITIAKALFVEEYKKQYAVYADKEKKTIVSYAGNHKIIDRKSVV